jgi:hypothetical protein
VMVAILIFQLPNLGSCLWKGEDGISTYAAPAAPIPQKKRGRFCRPLG